MRAFLRVRAATRGATALVLFIALLSGAPRSFAAGAALTHTQHFIQTGSIPAVDYCAGGTGTVTQTIQGVSHTTTVNGVVHYTETSEGTFTYTPTNPSNPSYMGHVTGWDGGRFSVSTGIYVDHLVETITATGSDGSHVEVHQNGYLTIDASGNVLSVKFDKFSSNCISSS